MGIGRVVVAGLGGCFIRAESPRSVILPVSSQMGRSSLLPGEISRSNPPLIPRLGLRPEMAATEPGSLGAPARRSRLPLASPVLPRACDPGGLAQPLESWSLRAPGTPSLARLHETGPAQVRPLVGGRSLGGDGGKPFVWLSRWPSLPLWSLKV